MDYDYDKPLGSIIADASIEDMKNYFEKGNAPRLELSDYHFTVVGHSPETPHYLKRFRVSTNPLYSIDFIVTKEMNDTWNILVELPYSRSNVANGFSSEEAAVRYLRSFIRKKIKKNLYDTLRLMLCILIGISRQTWISSAYLIRWMRNGRKLHGILLMMLFQ